MSNEVVEKSHAARPDRHWALSASIGVSVLLFPSALQAQPAHLPAPQWISNCIAQFETPAGRNAWQLMDKTPPSREENHRWCVEQWNRFYPSEAVTLEPTNQSTPQVPQSDLPPTILCQSHNQPDVTLLQKDRMLAGKNLDCIVGAFVSDLTPCAPRGGFGLSAPTGSVALVGVTDRWQDYTDHLGGITGHAVTSDRIIFSGGFNSPSGGYDEKWRFEVSRLSGKGLLVQDGKPEVEYSCRAADRKF